MPALLLLILIPLYLLALMAIIDALKKPVKKPAPYSPEVLQSKITELKRLFPNVNYNEVVK